MPQHAPTFYARPSVCESLAKHFGTFFAVKSLLRATGARETAKKEIPGRGGGGSGADTALVAAQTSRHSFLLRKCSDGGADQGGDVIAELRFIRRGRWGINLYSGVIVGYRIQLFQESGSLIQIPEEGKTTLGASCFLSPTGVTLPRLKTHSISPHLLIFTHHQT